MPNSSRPIYQEAAGNPTCFNNQMRAFYFLLMMQTQPAFQSSLLSRMAGFAPHLANCGFKLRSGELFSFGESQVVRPTKSFRILKNPVRRGLPVSILTMPVIGIH
jgi:hypothetical protein